MRNDKQIPSMLMVSHPKEVNWDTLIRVGKGFRSATEHPPPLLPFTSQAQSSGEIINKEEICNQVGVVCVFFWGGGGGREGKQDFRKDVGFTN